MKVQISKSSPWGEIAAPPSKSLAHRALICGALSDLSRVENLDFSKDISATFNCLKALGAVCRADKKGVEIGGLDPFNIPNDAILHCDESGSTLRFLIPLCLLSGKKVTLKGSKRLFERPLDIYEKICAEQGMIFEKNEDSLTLCGKLSSGNYRIPGNISSQFITGLLFALPLLDGVSIVEISGKFESESYIKLTLEMLSSCGIRVVYSANRFIIMGNQKYKPFHYTVEGDCSNAAFLDAFNHMGGNVKISGISSDTLQGDIAYKSIFRGLDEAIKQFDLSDCPDLAPICFALAAVKGGAEFVGTSRLRLKESDRSQTMKAELAKFGVDLQVEENSVKIPDCELKTPTESLYGHNDHRIVMALSVLSTLTGGIIEGAEAVSKSYPDFFEVLKTLNVKVDIYEDR